MSLKIRKLGYKELIPLFLALYPIINVYSVFSIPLGDWIALIFVGVYIIHFGRRKISVVNYSNKKKYYSIFATYVFCSLPILMFVNGDIDIGEIISKSIHFGLYSFVAFIMIRKIVDYSLLSYYVKQVTKISAYVVIFEQIFCLIFKKQLYLLLPFMKYSYLHGDYSRYIEAYTTISRTQGYRPSAFFLEPAHVCAYMSIGIVLYLCSEKAKKDYVNIVIILLATVFTYSTSGILSALLCMGIYIVISNRNSTQKGKERKFRIVMIAVGVIGLVYTFLGNERLLTTITGRIFGIGSSVYNSTGNIRVLRGWYVFNDLPAINRMFGTGIGCLLQSIKNNGIMVLMDTEYMDDMNTIFCVLSTFGIIGFAIYTCSILSNLFRSSYLRKMMCIAYVFSCIYSNWIYHSIIILFYAFIFFDSRSQLGKQGFEEYRQITNGL